MTKQSFADDTLRPSHIADVDRFLDTGGYATDPGAGLGDNVIAGAAVDAQRLADRVAHPCDVDPSLASDAGFSGVRMESTDDVVEQFGQIGEFSSSCSTPGGGRALRISVSRFPSAYNAAQAADAIHDHRVNPPLDASHLTPENPESLPDLPETHASSIAAPTSDQWILSTVTPHDELLIRIVVIESSDDRARAIDTATRAVRRQVDLLEGFRVTPVEALDDLRIVDDEHMLARTLAFVDDEHMLARTLAFVDNEHVDPSDFAVYSPRGWRHFDSEPHRTAELFDATGTDLIARANSVVYRTADPDEAESLRAGLVSAQIAGNAGLVEESVAPQDLPGTICWTSDDDIARSSVCFMVYERYVAELRGARVFANDDPGDDTLRTLSQRAAAQYVLFVRAEQSGLGEN